MELAELRTGTVVDCEVTRIEDYGAWVRVQNVECRGLILIPEITWGRVERVSDFFSVGDRVRALVRMVDLEREQVSLSVKDLEPDPWVRHAAVLVGCSLIPAEVISVCDHGVFVRPFKDVEGLVPSDSLTGVPQFGAGWRDAIEVGDRLGVRVRELNPYARKIALELGSVGGGVRNKGLVVGPQPNLLVIRSTDLARARLFYESLGLEFTTEEHGSGPRHLAAVFGGMVFETYPCSDTVSPTARTRLGFSVAELRPVLERVLEAGGTLKKAPGEVMGRTRCVVRDPDGHAVELVEAS